jgi:hypothetical protein
MIIFHEGNVFSDFVIDIIKESESKTPQVISHKEFTYPKDCLGYAHWGGKEEPSDDECKKFDLHRLTEGLQIAPLSKMPKESDRYPPTISKYNNGFRMRAENKRERSDGDMLYHIVLPDNFYVDREMCHMKTSSEILVMTRKKQRRQTITCWLASPNRQIDEDIFFTGPDESGFNSQEEKFWIFGLEAL